jgi:hypothetical protein
MQVSKQDKDKDIMNSLFNQRSHKQFYYSKINYVRAEAIIIKNILEVNLIKIAIEMVQNEHSALQKTFEVSAQDKPISVFVHPSQ